jgi:hypothetical protein
LSDPRAWVWTYASRSKNLKFFKSKIGPQKQTLPHSSRIFHSYTIELNCKFFFVCATYFINLLYLKRKEWKKNVEFQVIYFKTWVLHVCRTLGSCQTQVWVWHDCQTQGTWVPKSLGSKPKRLDLATMPDPYAWVC